MLTTAPDPEAHHGEHRYVAWREDGGYYGAWLLETDFGWTLKRFYGPYPPPGTVRA